MTEPSDTDRPRTFGLIRQHDVTGVSGTGRVADGTLWPDGTVSVRWRGDRPSIVHWGGLDDVEHVHGHGGHTRIAWDDEPTPAVRPPIAYSDGKGYVKTYCLTCPRSDDANFALTINDVNHWERCRVCDRFIVDVAEVTNRSSK